MIVLKFKLNVLNARQIEIGRKNAAAGQILERAKVLPAGEVLQITAKEFSQALPYPCWTSQRTC